METWPEQFPAPDTSFSVSTDPTMLRTSMDSGQVRQRRRFSTETTVLNVTWTLTDGELSLFTGFVAYRLNAGVDWFKITLPVTGGGFKEQTARFLNGRFDQTYVDFGGWAVSAKLEVLSRDLISPTLVDILTFVGARESLQQKFLDFVSISHQFLHQEMKALTQP
jgi:hypothetical protein